MIGLTGTQLNVKLNRKNPKAKWILLGDVHIGSNSYDQASFLKLRENILELAEDGPVIVTGMGDLLDSVLPKDKRFSIMEQQSPFSHSQQELFDWFKGLKKNKNIIFNGAIYGNHEAILLSAGIEPYKLLEELGVDSSGFVNHNLIHFTFGEKKETLRAVLGHMLGKGKTIKGFLDYASEEKFQKRLDGQIVPVKIFARGHTHELSVTSRCCSIYAPEELTDVNFTQHICETGSFLTQAYGKSSYAVSKGLVKQTVGYIEIDIDFNRKEKIEVRARFNGHLNAKKTLHIKGEV